MGNEKKEESKHNGGAKSSFFAKSFDNPPKETPSGGPKKSSVDSVPQDSELMAAGLEEENGRLQAEVTALREALKMAMETAAAKGEEKSFEPRGHSNATFMNLRMLGIGKNEYFKSFKPYTCCNMSECCFPSLAYKSAEDAVYKIQHDCCCLPCCCGYSFWDAKDKIGKYSLGGCMDAPLCGDLVVDAKFYDAKGNPKFVLKHTEMCCDSCKLCCTGCMNSCGCLTCSRYYCSDEQYRLYLQPIYRNDYDQTPVAHFKYLDRVAGPCSRDERMSVQIEPCDELTIEEMEILSFYLVLLSGPLFAVFQSTKFLTHLNQNF